MNTSPQPPRLADRLLRFFCAPHRLEEVQGDLHEEFAFQAQRMGERRARLRYWTDVLGFIKPFAMKRQPDQYPETYSFGPAMLHNYVKIAWRNLVSQRVYSLINLLGLSLGLTCVLLITVYLKNELTFDTFHAKADRIYRLTSTTLNGIGTEIRNQTGNTGAVHGPAFARSVPEIDAVTRMQAVFFNVRRGNEGFFQNAHYVDDNFFRTFSLPLIAGTPQSALAAINSIVLTQKGAEKYFGNAPALGQTLSLEIDGRFEPFVVTGVAADPPTNSSLQFEMLLSFKQAESHYRDDKWSGQYLATFFVLRPGTSPTVVEQKLARVFAELGREQVVSLSRERGYTEQWRFGLQPLTAIHLTMQYGGGNELAAPASPVVLYLLGGIAVFMLVIACINFVNLTVARSLRRAREVGVRKVIGGHRNQLMGQFLGESFLLSALAFGLALLATQFALPFFNTVANQNLRIVQLLDVRLGLLFGGLLLVTTLLAGVYPAFVLSRFNPVRALYGQVGFGSKNGISRGLVVVQFALSVFLIVATLAVFAQFDFLTRKELGYNPNQLIRIELPVQRPGNDNLARLFKQKLINQPGIVQVTVKDRLDNYTDVRANDKQLTVNYVQTDAGYLPTLGIKLAQGRNFSPAFASDTVSNALVNEAFVREAGWQDPIGKRVVFPERLNKTYQIIGVVRDYHFTSLHEKIRPQVFVGDNELGFGEVWVKISPERIGQTIALLNRVYHQIVPHHYYNYQFLDAILTQQYEMETRLRQIVTWAAGVCLFISCLGLFGIVAFSAERRTKEIGVRKVLGASSAEMAALFSRDFLGLIGIALSVAIPTAWWVLNRWLDLYPFRIQLSVWLFVSAALFTVGVALLTVSFQAIKAARLNPVKSLRSE